MFVLCYYFFIKNKILIINLIGFNKLDKFNNTIKNIDK